MQMQNALTGSSSWNMPSSEQFWLLDETSGFSWSGKAYLQARAVLGRLGKPRVTPAPLVF